MNTISLATPVEKLYMVGPVYAARLEKLEIRTVEHLLYHRATRYIDYSLTTPIRSLQPGEVVTVRGAVAKCQNLRTKGGKTIQKAIIDDGSETLEVIWFNQPFLLKTLKPGVLVSLSGKVENTPSRPQMISPEFETLKKTGRAPIHTGRLVPVYPETRGVSSKWLRSRIAFLLEALLPQIEDHLPTVILETENLLPLRNAVQQLHFPSSHELAAKAVRRLAFDEMLAIQLAALKRKSDWQAKKRAKRIVLETHKLHQFLQNLPFTLTAAQRRAVQEILTDLRSTRPMNRLLLGDVGSGKTVVAAVAMYAAFLRGFPSILMAPTEILAQQHDKTVVNLLAPYKVNVALVTGSQKKIPEKVDVLVGTHALLFHDLQPQIFGIVVIDEQHRFGVEQRASLIQRGSAPPHTLTMTATPIPRTIALSLYGDLDLSVLSEMPKGRIRVKTWVVPPPKREAAYAWIKNRLSQSEQAFIVCPLIETSTKESMLAVRAVREEYKKLTTEVFPNIKMDLLHGRLSSKEKERVISTFRKGETKILVTTPVVEVGIDIPNATIMMIEGAERFGLAQLHQLRGRVGRSNLQSYCLLFPSHQHGQSTKRLKAMETIYSGPELAELDFKLRGPGEMYGTRQHGFTNLTFASFSDAALITRTRAWARQLLAKDPNLTKHPALAGKLADLEKPIEPN